MNKYLRKIVVLTLVSVMVLGMSVNAFAADATQNTDSSFTQSTTSPKETTLVNDTDSIYLVKDYDRGDSTQTDSNSPAEDFVFTIEPYGVWNAGTVDGTEDGTKYQVSSTVTNIPALGVNYVPASDGTDEHGDLNVKVEGNKTTVTIPVAEGKAGTADVLKTKLTLPTYNSVGDFWYKVTETSNKTTGVIYSTNDSIENNNETENHAHGRTYYIHVQVVNDPSYDGTDAHNNKFFRSVTLHKTGPVTGSAAPTSNADYNSWASTNSNAMYNTSAKVNNIQNKYYAGTLTIKKKVTGNAGNKDKRFEVTVTFTKSQGTIITSDITYTAATSAEATDRSDVTLYGQTKTGTSWNKSGTSLTADTKNTTDALTNTVKIYLKHDESVTFKNIPYGVSYKVIETKPDDDTYKNQIEFTNGDATNEATINDAAIYFDGVSLAADTVYKTGTNAFETNDPRLTDEFGKNAVGTIADAADYILITNNKETAIDVGVITENAPFVAILAVAFAAVVVYGTRRKNMIEE